MSSLFQYSEEANQTNRSYSTVLNFPCSVSPFQYCITLLSSPVTLLHHLLSHSIHQQWGAQECQISSLHKTYRKSIEDHDLSPIRLFCTFTPVLNIQRRFHVIESLNISITRSTMASTIHIRFKGSLFLHLTTTITSHGPHIYYPLKIKPWRSISCLHNLSSQFCRIFYKSK